ncbi:GNAT family N-acetyltransferase [Actinokineospora sp.]|uniref:GNAT family N-acetyltransferase n=1 Tax=Actinokineospora sp. TaxID=1872133 RepID=UPI0040383E6B
MAEYTLRTLTDADLPTFSRLLANAFLADDQIEDITHKESLVFEPARAQGVYADDRLVGTGQVLSRAVCVPGGGLTPFGGVTSVGVAGDHRRRGVLTRIMRAQLHGMHETGAEPIAALWASEAAIYGRFGYGLASEYVRYDVTARTPFRPGVDLGPHPVREVPHAAALPVVRALYDRYAASRVGALARDDAHWAYHLHDAPARRQGASAYRFAVHPDGYAVFRVAQGWTDRAPDGRVSVRELVATSAQGHAALLRYLLDIDLIGHVEHDGAVDDPLTLLLQTPRSALRTVFDGLFVRLVDVDRALPVRTYSAPVDAVVELADEFCPWNAGRWRITVNDKGTAAAVRTRADADLATSTAELGAAFLGGTRLTTLAAAGRVREHTPGSVAALSAAFVAEREPACLEVF